MPVLAVVLAALHVVFHLSDPRLTEASALVDLGDAMVTVNDSGNAPLLFVLDARTGQTRRTIRFADANTDTEALAPAGRRAVWVADIGDNLAERAEVEVHRVPLDGGQVTTYRLRYADGPRDAESLFVLRGRLYVVSKEIFGGAFYAAPAHLDPGKVNVLRRVAPGPSIATDAAAYPDGRHVLVRDYGRATLYQAPSFTALGSFALPDERQGEGISIGPDGRIRLSSEGAGSAVLQVRLPAALARDVAPAKPAASSRTSASRSLSPRDGARSSGDDPSWWPWLGGAGVVVVAAAVAAVVRRRTLRP
jgi:hypothetical protein